MTLWTVLFSFVILKPVSVPSTAYPHLAQAFPGQPDTVRVYQTPDRRYWVEAQYPDRRLILQLSPANYQRLLAGLPPITVRPVDRLAYVAGQTIVALTVYPWAVPAALTPENEPPSEAAVALGMLSPLFWAGASALYAWHTPVTFAQGYAGLWGGLWGAFHGGNWVRSARGSLWGSLTGNLLSQFLVWRYQIPAAAVQRFANSQAYGYYHYLMLEGLFQWQFEAESSVPHRLATTLSIAEGYADLFLSRHDTTLTLGDALFELRLAIIGGEFLPALILSYDLARDTLSSKRVYSGASLVGHVAGLALGRYLSRQYNLSVPGALLTYLVPGLAHSFTGGLMLLLRPDPAVYPVLFIGTEVGITALAYRLVRQIPEHRWGALQRLQPFARPSSLPGQGTVLGVALRF